MVTAPASTGMTAMIRKAVISQDHANSGIFIKVMPGARRFRMVAMTLMAPMMDDMPSRCTAKIRKGNAGPVCSTSGGYMVQPPAGAPPGMNNVAISSAKANGRIQKPQLLMRGSAMSGAPIMTGSSQLDSPTKAGITPPKIITRACMVVIWLKNSGRTSCMPGWNSSARITKAMTPPTRNITRDNHRYRAPRSLWLVVVSQRRTKCGSGP